MELNIRPLNSCDYSETLVGWWKDWSWEAPKRDFLPDDGTGGFIVYDGDTPVCACFIYVTNSKVAWADWIISNKSYTDKKGREHSLKLLLLSLTNACKLSGCKFVYALIKNDSLISKYEDLGYVKGDSYQTEMIKKL